MKKKTRIVIIGGTSAIAEHCARLWAMKEPVDMTLVGRSRQRLENVAADLRVRSPLSEFTTMTAEFVDPGAIADTAQRLLQEGPIDVVLIAHGLLPDQGTCQSDLQACQEALAINGLSPVLYAEAFAQQMSPSNRGTIAVIGSVAGDRGRKSNYVYGAAKGLVTRYAQGLQHRFAGTGLKIILIKPGPTATPMTAHLQAKGMTLASVESVAQDIVHGIARGQSVIYTPAKWHLIMRIVQHLPAALFNKLNV